MRILLSLLILTAFTSCSKESLTTPDKHPTEKTSAVLPSYKDANITLKNFEAKSANAQVQVSFTVVFANDVETVEILRGLTPATLCSIYKQDVTGINITNTLFSTIDSEETSSTQLYYMVKYTLADGDWSYTPVIELQTPTGIGGN